MRERELTDAQWAALEPHLPPRRPATGRPAKDHRTVVEGILWRLRTGAPWRDAPERYGPWQTLYSRFRRWQRAGVWDRALAAVQAEADARGELDWTLHFLDGTTVRAHPHAAGAKRGAATRRSAAPAAAGGPSSTSAPSAAASRSASS
ncbi:MAG: Mobile element protein [uncultured Thermomicrobiales bacterium]|uniref:Mobile element protein n=1 Tax=uncultured Thermomicrobiales bacterium TaxID=1645740 RepID=A0A6J4VCN4_9BACT|nr:MAG: Mobile element protein [uncultured Thermomicrobiales bacterium]